MSYQKPVCDCGNELELFWEESLMVRKPITSKGFESKRESTIRSGLGHCATLSRLSCPECMKEYQYDFDKQGRIVKTGKWDY